MIPTAAVVTIGRELLTGRVVDTHRATLGAWLWQRGIVVGAGFVVDDRISDIARAVRRAWSDGYGLVLTTGGLGPSEDDRTAAGIALAWDRMTTVDEAQLARVVDTYTRAGLHARPDDPGTIRMATVPVGAELLPNPVGAAAGLWLADRDRASLSLPGVPAEVNALLSLERTAELVAPWSQGVWVRRERSVPTCDERVLAAVIRAVGSEHRGVDLKPEGHNFAGEPLKLIAETLAPNAAAGAAAADAALAAVAAALERAC